MWFSDFSLGFISQKNVLLHDFRPMTSGPSLASAFGGAPAYVDLDDDPSRRGLLNRPSGADAKAVAQTIARAPTAERTSRPGNVASLAIFLAGNWALQFQGALGGRRQNSNFGDLP